MQAAFLIRRKRRREICSLLWIADLNAQKQTRPAAKKKIKMKRTPQVQIYKTNQANECQLIHSAVECSELRNTLTLRWDLIRHIRVCRFNQNGFQPGDSNIHVNQGSVSHNLCSSVEKHVRLVFNPSPCLSPSLALLFLHNFPLRFLPPFIRFSVIPVSTSIVESWEYGNTAIESNNNTQSDSRTACN